MCMDNFKDRQDNNRKLLAELTKLVEENRVMRFGQILVNFGFVIPGDDPFFEEPDRTLERVKVAMKISNR